ncbi:UrcA family protein [Phenylobacterium sp. LjRoot164]|uniref:UrcA family protein n=1 Tax=unclassified Phenylobacterium TaxID=2640670 RepID=UPI003ECC2348
MLAKTLLVAAAALGLSSAAHAAQPVENPDQTVSVAVPYGDLNINREAGATIALQRINNAAAEVCGRESQVTSLDRMALHQACVRSTVDRTVTRLGNPVVAALNSGQEQSHTMLAMRH